MPIFYLDIFDITHISPPQKEKKNTKWLLLLLPWPTSFFCFFLTLQWPPFHRTQAPHQMPQALRNAAPTCSHWSHVHHLCRAQSPCRLNSVAITLNKSTPNSPLVFASCSITLTSVLSLLTLHWLCSSLKSAVSKLISLLVQVHIPSNIFNFII